MKQTHTGLAIRIPSCAFVNNLGILCDALQELSKLSLKLQKEIVPSFQPAGQFREIRVFESMSDRPGRYTEVSQWSIEADSFHRVTLN